MTTFRIQRSLNTIPTKRNCDHWRKQPISSMDQNMPVIAYCHARTLIRSKKHWSQSEKALPLAKDGSLKKYNGCSGLYQILRKQTTKTNINQNHLLGLLWSCDNTKSLFWKLVNKTFTICFPLQTNFRRNDK